jgi:hypothetical protein
MDFPTAQATVCDQFMLAVIHPPKTIEELLGNTKMIFQIGNPAMVESRRAASG